ADLRLLNLVLADIGAGTSDIAVCRDGTVVGYTMATIAGDEITEELMRRYLIPFATAERMKTQLREETITYRDVLGLEQSVPGAQVAEAIQQPAQALAQEIAQRVVALNGAPPSALFLAGGGSKLEGLREMVAEALKMDQRRVALAGNNYEMTAFADGYDLNDPELATPLGIAVSAGLGLISDSYRIMLNGQPAKLFRSGALTVLELLMMNGYTSADLLGRTGKNLSVTVDGRRMVFRGQPASPCVLRLNGQESAPSALVYAGDSIEFTPAVPGEDARRAVKDLLGQDFSGGVTVNGRMSDLDVLLETGDQVVTFESGARAPVPAEEPEAPDPKQAPVLPAPPVRSEPVQRPIPVEIPAPIERPAPVPPPRQAPREEPKPISAAVATPLQSQRRPIRVTLNGGPLQLPGKPEGAPYYLMDLLEHSGIDFENLDRGVELQVNGAECAFTQELRSGDNVIIRYLEK
ncbi:MAG: pilus assembly protein PilM, partial [Lawsonibacter sp.]|nr:pilus assembly protein PilM [Lawsonibacter sp.]